MRLEPPRDRTDLLRCEQPESRLVVLLLFLLVLCTAAFYKDFSAIRLQLSGLPLYVTELVLLAIIGLYLHGALRIGTLVVPTGTIAVAAWAFLIWGAVALMRGAGDGLIALREYATNYYCVVLLGLLATVRSTSAIDRIWKAILAGTLIAFGVVALRMATGQASITSTGALRYHAPVAVGAAGLLGWAIARPNRRRLDQIISGSLALGAGWVIIVGTQHRSAALALGVALLAWLLVFHKHRGAGAVGSPRTMIAGIVLAGVLVVGLPGSYSSTVQRLGTIGRDTEEYNAAWRLLNWSLVLQGAFEAPVVGHGFGANLPSFQFRDRSYGIESTSQAGVHNSFLFIFYKEGLVGVLLILFLIFALIRRSFRASGASSRGQASWRASAALVGVVFTAVFACFNVVLEGPFMGVLFWAYAALAEAGWRYG